MEFLNYICLTDKFDFQNPKQRQCANRYEQAHAKFPGYVDGSGVGHAYKFWPAFWTYHQELVGPCSTQVHDEIDIVDPGGTLYSDGKTYGGNLWNEVGDCSNYSVFSYQYEYSHLCNSYHKYAVEWNTDRVIFYFDNVPISAKYNDAAFVMDPQRLVIDQPQKDAPKN